MRAFVVVALFSMAGLAGLAASASGSKPAPCALDAPPPSPSVPAVGPAPLAPANVGLSAVSDDGRRIFFQTARQLLERDRDRRVDIYKRTGSQLTLVSTGSRGDDAGVGASLEAISANGSRAFFTTADALVRSDTDHDTDLYERFGATTVLLSRAPSKVPGGGMPTFEHVSSDGARVLFDVDPGGRFEYRGGAVDRIRAPGHYVGASADGSHLFFQSGPNWRWALGGLFDLHNGRTTRIARNARLGGSTSDARAVVFETKQPLTPHDHDRCLDVYKRRAGRNVLISKDPVSARPDFDSHFQGMSSDASRIFFGTQEAMVASVPQPTRDRGNPIHIYERAHGQTKLVATPGVSVYVPPTVSADGSHVIYETGSRIVKADRDSARDVYEFTNGVPKLVSTSSRDAGHASARFAGASSDGRRIFFAAKQQLLASDHDDAWDFYERRGHATHLVSAAAPGLTARQEVFLESPLMASLGFFEQGHSLLTSSDGRRAFFATGDRLSHFDRNRFRDVYGSVRGRSYLVSG
ncbi:MAG: hypothetical protein QOJ38_1717 [Solirubrobacterales bacterium]|jgi:hypothetical protein|nr:hypothetical protein [Solirubrobacterales bacterium]